MRRRSCRGAGSTTAALAHSSEHDLFRKPASTFRDHALELLLAFDRRRQIQRALHRAHLAMLLQHRVILHRRTLETFRAPHHAAHSGAAVTAAELIATEPTEPAEHRKAPLLALIKTVVERP